MNLCVFCSSRNGLPLAKDVVAFVGRLGRVMADSNMNLIYGGAKVGLMGLLADAVIDSGGNAIGIIPEFLINREVAHEGLTELVIVPSMHERKIEMFKRSDAYLTLPGGFGTLDELFEVLTLSQLGQLNYNGKVLIYNPQGFYDPLLAMASTMRSWGYIDDSHLQMMSLIGEEKSLFQSLMMLSS